MEENAKADEYLYVIVNNPAHMRAKFAGHVLVKNHISSRKQVFSVRCN
jgi:hypothetical protein